MTGNYMLDRRFEGVQRILLRGGQPVGNKWNSGGENKAKNRR